VCRAAAGERRLAAKRRNAALAKKSLWMLIALSCTLWMFGLFQWTYYEVYQHKPLPDLYPGDVVFFLRGIPLMASARVASASQGWRQTPPFWLSGFCAASDVVDVFLHLQRAALDVCDAFTGTVQHNYNVVTTFKTWSPSWDSEFSRCGRAAPGGRFYANLFGAATTYMLASLTLDVAADVKEYYTGVSTISR